MKSLRSMNSLRYMSLAAITSAVLFTIGCEQQKEQVAPPAPATVSVAKPERNKVGDFIEFTGTTDAVASVDVRARVKGFLKTVNFKDGAYVKEGDLLFEIEPDVFKAQVDAANANVQAAQARLTKAKADLSIKEEMAKGNAASKLDVIQAEAAVGTATADVSEASAKLQQANIDLGYTKIAAPLTGRIDKSRLTAGNLVGSDGNTLLASIVQSDPIYVYFEVDEATVQRFQARLRAQKVNPTGDRPTIPITLSLGDTEDFRFKGTIDYVDNKVDTATGTIKVRATLPNDDRSLTPGFFARIKAPDGDPYDAVLVPERSIGVDQGQKYVFVVNDKNVVESRPIEVGTQQGRMRVVKKGLTADDWIITDGLLRTRPGAIVAPQQKSATTEPSGATAALP
jgi:RND family efflux transporter MFP subunit